MYKTKSQMIWRIAELSELNQKLAQKLEDIRQYCITYMGNDATRPIYESILKIIDGESELLPEDEIPF